MEVAPGEVSPRRSAVVAGGGPAAGARAPGHAYAAVAGAEAQCFRVEPRDVFDNGVAEPGAFAGDHGYPSALGPVVPSSVPAELWRCLQAPPGLGARPPGAAVRSLP